jgi:hypothetical protein
MVFGRAYRQDNPACPAPSLHHLPRPDADARATHRRDRDEGATVMRVRNLAGQHVIA